MAYLEGETSEATNNAAEPVILVDAPMRTSSASVSFTVCLLGTVTISTLLGPRNLFVEGSLPRKIEFRTPPRRFDPP